MNIDISNINQVELSIVIPVYNAKDYLSLCLDSVLAALQTINAEVICVDDGSTDGSDNLLKKYAKEHPIVKVYSTNNIKAGAARNYGLTKAKGKYIAFVDSDDIVVENLYKDMLYHCEKNQLNLCVCNVTRLEGSAKGAVSGQYQRAFSGEPRHITSIQESMSFIYDGGPWNKLIRRDFWNEHGFQFPKVGHYEDMPLFLKLFCTVDRFAVIQSFGYYWRITPGGNSISQQVGLVDTLTDRIEVCTDMHNYLSEKYGAKSLLCEYMERRLLFWEFDSNLWHFEKLDEDTKRVFCGKIKDFYLETISEESLTDIPIFHKKRYEYIMEGDVESLTRLMNHRRIGWRSAPIVERDGKHYLKLPTDIYGDEYVDAATELQDDIPVTRMSVFTQDGAKVKLNVVVYQPRVNVPKSDSQEIKAFLYNEHTGRKIYLQCEPLKVEPWTKTYGMMICNDDYRVYNYNYDWSGVTITMDFEEILAQDEESRNILDETEGVSPRWMIFVEYKNPVLEGIRPIRGFLPKARNTIPEIDVTLEYEGEKYKYDFVQSIRDSLYIEMNKL